MNALPNRHSLILNSFHYVVNETQPDFYSLKYWITCYIQFLLDPTLKGTVQTGTFENIPMVSWDTSQANLHNIGVLTSTALSNCPAASIEDKDPHLPLGPLLIHF